MAQRYKSVIAATGGAIMKTTVKSVNIVRLFQRPGMAQP
jgi:hypothetical protein